VAAFNTMTARLEENEQQRQRLLADIAHELRTPIAVVQGTIEAMLDEVYPMDRAHLAPLLDQTHAVARLLDDLQTLATTEAGTLSLHRSATDIDDLVRASVMAFGPAASRAGIALRAEVTTDTSLDLDQMRIRQVLDNLITNALRFTPAGGEIVVTTRTTPDGVAVVVRDTGRGMEQADAERMFERFVKAADSGGSGLGLAIARGLVQAHGGEISAISAPDTGTTVTFTLPRDSPPFL
jgi:signal transduction histidine kinase